ncbi:MAG: cation:proton antiporter [Planctomycetes bacterium]|nr:cation:proton antiporter [Planctomycetota bacterium]
MEWASTVSVALVAALVFGLLARRLGLSPIVGYLVAGVAIGPHTPGFVGNAELAAKLADVGVVLLMFGVGLGFSFGDLWGVRRIAVPGALLASGVAVAAGTAIGRVMGWSWGASLVLGMCFSCASTVVIVRGLMDSGLLASATARIVIGWSVVEDLITVGLLVALPALAGGGGAAAATPLWQLLLWSLAKVAVMAVVVILGGGLVVPKLLALVARAGSKELFTLAVLAVALGVAYASSSVFDVSLALGAFFGGMVVGRSDLSHQALADALPLRDAFAVLFFVAVGMLFDPRFVVQHPVLVVAGVGVVLVAKPLAAVGLMLGRGYSLRNALLVGAGIAQVSEFSFVLAGLALSLGLLPEAGHSLVLATALLSITANPLLFRGVKPLGRLLSRQRHLARLVADRSSDLAGLTPAVAGGLQDHVVLCGLGRVGSVLGELLQARGIQHVVVELDREMVESLRARGAVALYGDCASPIILDRAEIQRARALVLTVPDAVASRLAAEHARAVNPTIQLLVRVHSQGQAQDLARYAGVRAVHGERELGFAMARHLLEALGASTIEAEAAVLAAQRGLDAGTSPPRLYEVSVPRGSGAIGQRIAGLELPQGLLVVAIVRDGQHLVARGPTILLEGDVLLLFATGADAREVERMVARRAEPLPPTVDRA